MPKITAYFVDRQRASKYFLKNYKVNRQISDFFRITPSKCQLFLSISEPAKECDLIAANHSLTTYIAKPRSAHIGAFMREMAPLSLLTFELLNHISVLTCEIG